MCDSILGRCDMLLAASLRTIPELISTENVAEMRFSFEPFSSISFWAHAFEHHAFEH